MLGFEGFGFQFAGVFWLLASWWLDLCLLGFQAIDWQKLMDAKGRQECHHLSPVSFFPTTQKPIDV